MSRERFDEALVQELERELRDALAIEPSPDFAQKVRARIAARQSPAVWWKFALPVAAACALVVGLGVWGHWRPGESAGAIVQRAGSDVGLRPEVRSKPDAKVSANRPKLAAVRTKVRTIPESTAEPEVIVPPDRAVALARFLELARRGAVNEETLKPVASAAPPPVLEIAPIVVTPLSVPELEPQSGVQTGANRE
jgi:hypothetical protein